jgi:hypothetical protein
MNSTAVRISLIPARFSRSFGDKGNNNGDQAEKDNDENEKIVPRVVIGQERGIIVTVHALIFIHLDQPTEKLGPGLFAFEDTDDDHEIDHNRQSYKNEHDDRAASALPLGDTRIDSQSQKVEEDRCDDKDRIGARVLLKFFNNMLVNSLDHDFSLLWFDFNSMLPHPPQKR